MKKTKANRPALIGPIMMISDRHKTNNLVTLFCCLWWCLLVAQANGNGTSTSAATTTTTAMLTTMSATTKTNANQDEVNGLALTPDVTTAPRLDHNNNNEWRPLGHGDPLQKDPTYDYSPPALERVRYWAENNASGLTNPEARKKELPPEVLKNKTKSEILLLGVASERERGTRAGQQVMHYTQRHSSYPKIMPSKYPAIRRSYYAPQQQQQHHQQQLQQQQYMPHTHLMPPPPMSMMMKGLEYRSGSAPYHSLSHMSASSKQPMTTTHHYYASPSSTSNWATPHRMTYTPDAYHQETMQHFSFSRPQSNSVNYSPNSLQGHHTKPPTAHRKPWLHELLQKELVKPKVKPTMPATKYLMGTTKPFTMAYTPVSFVSGPPTIAGPTVLTPTDNQIVSDFRPMMMTTTAAASPPTTTTAATTTTTTTPMPIYQRPTTASSMMPMGNSVYTGTRLLIPQTSNLAQRPTVATGFDSDIRQTTDSLFSHYKQPPKALLGPAYLIIEGHSKVKTYGQNELDPHSPKIVPVISKREPVVRLADPNEPKRGTVETFEVKHLHTKTTPFQEKTTTTSTARPSTTIATKATTTTMKPLKTTVKSSISSTTQSTPRTTKATTSTTTTTATPLPTTTTTTTTAATESNGVHDLLSLLDNMFADAHEIVSPSAPSSALLSSPTLAPINYVTSTMSTILKPVSSSTKLLPQQPEPRIKSQAANSILSIDGDDNDGDEDDDHNDRRSEIITSTELPLRATRQVFDYDQLPESRIKDKEDGLTAAVDYLDEEDEADELGEAALDAASLDEDGQDEDANDEVEQEGGEQAEDGEHNLLKRIDQFVDDVDDGDDDLDDLIEGLDDEHDPLGEADEEDEEASESQERRHYQH